MYYKVLSIGNFGTGWDGSICDEEHIAKALEDLGHEVFRCQRYETVEAPIDIFFDFVLIAQWDGYKPNFIEQIRERWKCPIVYWAFDYQADGQEWHERLVKKSDLYLSKRIADSKYPNWQWFRQDFAPDFLNKDLSFEQREHFGIEEKDIDVLFTGSYLPWATERNETLKAVNEKFNLVIHSVNSWPKEFKDVRPPIMDEGLPELYARAKIVLSIDHTLEAGYWSDRNAQAMCCRAYVLSRYVPLAEDVFNSGVDFFYSVEDCLKQIECSLRNGMHREFVADTGYAVATYCNRLRVSGRAYDLINVVKSIL